MSDGKDTTFVCACVCTSCVFRLRLRPLKWGLGVISKRYKQYKEQKGKV